MYDAFRRIVDYFYLNDVGVIESINDSTEMMEIIKLAKVYQLKNLFTAAESHFREIMFTCFDASNTFSLKLRRQDAKGSPTGDHSVRDALQSRRVAAQNNQNEVRPNENQ